MKYDDNAAPTRRAFMKTIAAAGMTLPFGITHAEASTSRPNILFIVTDDQGMQMGCMDTPGLSTPHMDGLADAGTLFTNSWCAFPSCSPARASILTGMHPHTHGMTANVHEHVGPAAPPHWNDNQREHNKRFEVRAEIPTLIEVLKETGYHTAVTSKFHLAPHEKFPFDTWSKENSSDAIQQCIQEAGDAPFFLFHNIRSPHRPFRLFMNQRKRKVIDPESVVVPPYLPDTPQMRLDWAEYLTACEITDTKVGEALAALRESGQYENTLIVFLGDNGPAFHRGKFTAYDFGFRTPLIISGPGIQQGKRNKALMSHVDLMPTLLNYLDIPLPAPVHGQSLTPLLKGANDVAPNDYIVGEVQYGHGPKAYRSRAITDGRFHYIRRKNTTHPHVMPADNFQEKPWGNHSYQATLEAEEEFPFPYALLKEWDNPAEEELFDLHSDPWCMHTLAEDATYAEALSKMRIALEQWIRDTEDTAMKG